MILERSEKYAKETDEVMLLLVDIVKKAKAKASIADIAAGELANLMNALSGADQIDDEFSANFEVTLRTVTARAGELAAALVKPAEAPIVPAVG